MIDDLVERVFGQNEPVELVEQLVATTERFGRKYRIAVFVRDGLARRRPVVVRDLLVHRDWICTRDEVLDDGVRGEVERIEIRPFGKRPCDEFLCPGLGCANE